MGQFTNKVALVTGGGRDIGRAICEKFSAEGASVVVNYHASAERAEETVSHIKERGGVAIAVQADVTQAEEVQRMIEATQKAFGEKIHFLVNNAGGLVGRKRMDEMDESFWEKVLRLNLTSVFLVTRAVLPHMANGGAIVNLSSLAARDGGGGGALAYATAKGGVLTFTRGLAKELKSRKIRVNCVSPGLIDTTFHDTFTMPGIREKVAQATLAGREGTSEDVANAVLFLASEASAYINGESIEINGGLYFV